MKNKDKELLLDFVKENSPCVSSFGKFDVKDEKDFFIIECELITSLENPFENLTPTNCRVNKKSFLDWKERQNPIIFY